MSLAVALILATTPTASPFVSPFISQDVALAFDAGAAAPHGIFGGGLTYMVDFPWAVEVGGGLGATGSQAAVTGRWHHLLDAGNNALVLSGGPSVGVLSRSLGTNVPHAEGEDIDEDSLYAVSWFNLGVGWEGRTDFGLFGQAEMGGALRLLDNQSGLCRGVDSNPRTNSEAGGCGSMHMPIGPEIARVPIFPYLTFGFGWAFGLSEAVAQRR